MTQDKEFERMKRIIRKLRMIDDIFFQKMFEDKAACEEILRICLADPGLRVLEVTPQKKLKNLQGRSVRLDAHCKLGDGRHVDAEVQRADHDDHLRRVRYNGACLTVNITETGTDFRQIPDVCVVYITEFDLFGMGRTLYHVEKRVRETGQIIDDGRYDIYLNTRVDDGSLQAALMKNFLLEDVADERFPEVSRRFYTLKHDKAEVRHMCKELAEYREEGRMEGLEEGRMEGLEAGKEIGWEEGRAVGLEAGRMEGREEARRGIVQKLAAGGMSGEKIAQMLDIALETIQKWLEEPMTAK